MSLSDLASLGSFVSGVAVLASLVFLFFQMRQMTEQVRQAERNQQAAIRQARSHKRIDMFRDRAVNDALDEAIYLSIERPSDMTLAQYRQVTSNALAAYSLAEDTYYQRKQGLMSDIAYDFWLSNIKRATFALPNLRAHWPLVRHAFTDEFAEFVDKLIAESRPRALDIQSGFVQW